MLHKLQRKTIILPQIIGYAFTLFIGSCIVIIVSQFYLDIKPLLVQNTDVFNRQSAVISKHISIFKTLDKDKIYFTQEEIDNLQRQPFVKSVSQFNNATFKIKAFTEQAEDIPVFYTDLFFESIPDAHLDVKPETWKWNESYDFIPIIIPESYLTLYNFGFAESQGLPVLSKHTISQVEFNIRVSGNLRSKSYKSRIVGFSNKINSILVPEDFLSWANQEFGSQNIKTSRLLVEFNNPSDPAILAYLNQNNYAINQEKLELSKMVFFMKSAMIFVFTIAIIIVILSFAFILLSINLIIQKNKSLLQNLYAIGYSYKTISKFYQVSISAITLFSLIASMAVAYFIRVKYMDELHNFFDFESPKNYTLIFGGTLIIILIAAYNIMLINSIKKAVMPSND